MVCCVRLGEKTGHTTLPCAAMFSSEDTIQIGMIGLTQLTLCDPKLKIKLETERLGNIWGLY